LIGSVRGISLGVLSITNGIGVRVLGFIERRSGYDRVPREMHKIICADCGKEDEVPFKPTEGRPVYCKECFEA